MPPSRRSCRRDRPDGPWQEVRRSQAHRCPGAGRRCVRRCRTRSGARFRSPSPRDRYRAAAAPGELRVIPPRVAGRFLIVIATVHPITRSARAMWSDYRQKKFLRQDWRADDVQRCRPPDIDLQRAISPPAAQFREPLDRPIERISCHAQLSAARSARFRVQPAPSAAEPADPATG